MIKEIMHIDEYIERQMHEDYMRLKEVDLQLNKYEKIIYHVGQIKQLKNVTTNLIVNIAL